MPISINYNEDNMVTMKRFPDGFIDLAIVDPQTGQNEGKRHVGRVRQIKQRNGSFMTVANKHVVKDWDNEPPTQEYYDELFRISKHQIIMCEPRLHFTQKDSSAGRIVWNLLRKNDFSACQIMWTSLFNKVEYFEYMWNGMIQGVDINVRKGIGNKKLNEPRIHPSQKPCKVYRHLLTQYAKPGFKIYDSHSGSGNLRRVCFEMGFDFYGSEIDTDYHKQDEELFQLLTA